MPLPDLAIEELLSTLIQRAAEIHEKSYQPARGMTYEGGYSVPIEVAAHRATREVGGSWELARIVYLLLINSWNDSLEWAEYVRSKIHGPRS